MIAPKLSKLNDVPIGTLLEDGNKGSVDANINDNRARNLLEEDGLSFEEFDHTLPQILTRNTVLPSLSTLDAGDVIECYALVRKAKLDTVGTRSMNSNGFAEINNLTVDKSAIAFRYKPKSSSPDVVMKSPFELTLEYGPQRSGAMQSFEAMPSVNGHARDLDPESGEYKSGDGKYVTWENHAKIYYTLSISDEEWQNAYFMAPITGAVLSKIMNDYIVEYPIRHPRFQPFTIVEKETGKTIVKSSNSDDFIWNIFKALADMYVDIQPIVTPKRYAVQIYVENKERDFENIGSQKIVDTTYEGSNNADDTITMSKMYVANAAAKFYDKLFSCMGAIQTGDYSAFENTPEPSAYPSHSPSQIPTANPTVLSSASPSSAPTISSTNSATSKTSSTIVNDTSTTSNETDASLLATMPPTVLDEEGGDDDEREKDDDGSAKKKKKLAKNVTGDSEQNSNNVRKTATRKAKLKSHEKALVREFDENEEQKENKGDNNDDNNDNDYDTMNGAENEEINYVLNAEFAAQEAMEAAEAAQEAAESNQEHEAAVAAGQAAKAAKKAAQATNEAANLAAIDSIYSGDGDMMTSILSTCFTERKYNIRHDEVLGNEIVSTSTNAYVYIDGSHYYRLNLTAPYMSVVTMNNPLPTTVNLSEGKGDFIDISLAFFIIGGFLFGVFVMLHHIRLINFDSRMKFEWFFHPTKYQGGHKRLDGLAEDVETYSMDDDDEEGIRDDRAFVGNPRTKASDQNGIELSARMSSNAQVV